MNRLVCALRLLTCFKFKTETPTRGTALFVRFDPSFVQRKGMEDRLGFYLAFVFDGLFNSGKQGDKFLFVLLDSGG